ncbi:VOC family protein [Rhodococcus sp. BP-252]|uniref:VOC family protein n=1 Tax=unclassified Rhodococcus (in: high G+C Gram-positive bacteria) TaxID=192944 RepID=UPI001C9B1B28|nr:MULTISPECIES: VOC family protein [unclassified Rhodococcus (in: high G+C Gram-positive bacteria)]MBY6413540.1 VOC family protein [Rhodococcus sp. BP-320]MBY6418264.1 VOC family protein [Rhodococcus sp. BP-321]MBY6422678.1 VOC family protein [Rhodococcus sp. BP-324]MBY6428209.1 VOC family protein [Rhodococcus sp. BP-323]MBY6433387.1 VOC family protein [Rhodococcus sp. BP-322]
MDIRIELIMIPVTDVDRAKKFYTSIGFVADYDERPTDDIRYVQLTPPGSACSIAISENITKAAPGSVEGMQVVVDSAQEAYDHLTAAGLEIDPVVDQGWGKFVYFSDPDGNKWAVQELPKG